MAIVSISSLFRALCSFNGPTDSPTESSVSTLDRLLALNCLGPLGRGRDAVSSVKVEIGMGLEIAFVDILLFVLDLRPRKPALEVIDEFKGGKDACASIDGEVANERRGKAPG